jgi:N-acetylglucosaminyl-diphospho-decaprenol L-rhamnosyltransferase
MIELSIIIVSYDSHNWIERCLLSLQKFNDIEFEKYEIIIIENSKLLTTNYKEKFTDTFSVEYFSNPVNGGFGQGNNVGAFHAKGEILLFLNPDTELITPVFKEAVNLLRTNSDIGSVGCDLIYESGKPNYSYGYLPEKASLPILLLDALILRKYGIYNSKWIYPWGACMFVRKRDFISAGRFDDKIFLTHEEPDLAKRMHPKTVYMLDKKVIHYGGHTIKNNKVRAKNWYTSFVGYQKKHSINMKNTHKHYYWYYLTLVFYYKILKNKERTIELSDYIILIKEGFKSWKNKH